MELRHLRYFLVVAEELSFTAAAARLRISQPPLSQQIQDLETELKTTLFLRTSRKVELTPAGIAFLDHVRSILGQVGQAVEQTQAIGSGKSGKLDIGATGSVLLGPLASIIAHYSRQHPEVLVRLHEMAAACPIRLPACPKNRHQLSSKPDGGSRARHRSRLAGAGLGRSSNRSSPIQARSPASCRSAQ